MRSIDSLKRYLEALKKQLPQPEVTFRTCWGNERPDNWQEGEYIVTEWGTSSLEDEDEQGLEL